MGRIVSLSATVKSSTPSTLSLPFDIITGDSGALHSSLQKLFRPDTMKQAEDSLEGNIVFSGLPLPWPLISRF